MSDTKPPDAPSEDFETLEEVRTAQGSTPFIELALVARWIVSFVLIMIGIMLFIYFKA